MVPSAFLWVCVCVCVCDSRRRLVCGCDTQWLCNADTSRAEPRVRLKRFFTSLYNSLTRGARAVLQLYPVREHGTPAHTVPRLTERNAASPCALAIFKRRQFWCCIS